MRFTFQSGKTMLANFLSDATENPSEEYRPTHVVRILEFEAVSLNQLKPFYWTNLNLFISVHWTKKSSLIKYIYCIFAET